MTDLIILLLIPAVIILLYLVVAIQHHWRNSGTVWDDPHTRPGTPPATGSDSAEALELQTRTNVIDAASTWHHLGGGR